MQATSPFAHCLTLPQETFSLPFSIIFVKVVGKAKITKTHKNLFLKIGEKTAPPVA